MTFNYLRQVRPNVVKIHLVLSDLFLISHFFFFDKHQRCAFEDRVVRGHGNLEDQTACSCRNDMLHLHRFEHRNLLSFCHARAFGNIDTHDPTLQV